MLPRNKKNGYPRLLILEEDEDVLVLLFQGLNRSCCSAESIAAGDGRCACDPDSDRGPCTQVIGSLRELHNLDLSKWEVVVCASALADGTGIDALAFVRGTRTDLPVILTGPPGESALAVEGIRAGASDFLLTTGGNLLTLPLAIEKCLAQHRIKEENERLHADLSRSLSETAVKNQQLQALIQQLETMARTDDLTGLCNRRWFNLMLDRSWAEALRSGTSLSFAMMDLDGFKTINDRRGHQHGDELLRLTGRVIQANSRQVDLPARYGGDEFCILLPNTDAYEAGRVLQRIASAFDSAMAGFAEDAPLTMSVGISHIQLSRPANADQFVRHADEALYAAKSAGKCRVMIHTKDAIVPYDQIAPDLRQSATTRSERT